MSTSQALPTRAFTGSPFLRWAGSKRKLLTKLRRLVPRTYGTYYEPFAGSACLFFSLNPRRAVLADINEELIDTYAQIRDDVESVVAHLSGMRRSKSLYYKIRRDLSKQFAPSERAARFIYLNRYCFNGIYRTNLAGRFNVPYGGDKTGRLPSPEHLRGCAKVLRDVTLRCQTFGKTIQACRPGDFVYLDPPYQISSRRVFGEYSTHAFDDAQLRLLRVGLEALDRKGVYFLVTYGLSKEAAALGSSFHTIRTSVQRSVAGFAAERRVAQEVLITNVPPKLRLE